MKTIFLDREIENLKKLDRGWYKLNLSGKAKLREFEEIKLALNLPVVSKRSELLKFMDWHYEEDIADQKTKEAIVDTYLK